MVWFFLRYNWRIECTSNSFSLNFNIQYELILLYRLILILNATHYPRSSIEETSKSMNNRMERDFRRHLTRFVEREKEKKKLVSSDASAYISRVVKGKTWAKKAQEGTKSFSFQTRKRERWLRGWGSKRAISFRTGASTHNDALAL